MSYHVFIMCVCHVIPLFFVYVCACAVVSVSVPVVLSVSEEDVMVCVNLTGALERDVLVQVTTMDGTARGKYSPSPNSPLST